MADRRVPPRCGTQLVKPPGEAPPWWLELAQRASVEDELLSVHCISWLVGRLTFLRKITLFHQEESSSPSHPSTSSPRSPHSSGFGMEQTLRHLSWNRARDLAGAKTKDPQRVDPTTARALQLRFAGQGGGWRLSTCATHRHSRL